MKNFATATALELIHGYRVGEFSPVEVIDEILDRIDQLQCTLNAFYIVDYEGARAAARASESRWFKGTPCGLLDGVPSSIKDALPSIGEPSYRGSAAHVTETQVWDWDAPPIARMREAGAIFLGKTTMPDFGILATGASSKHGITRNPWDPAYTPGGSSAGTAVSVAAGINPIAVGTDIVGSIRLPASFCGIFGLKPSQGRVPYYFPNSPSLVAGPMARTVTDAALLLNVIGKADRRDYTALPLSNADYLALIQEDVPSAKVGFISDMGFGTSVEGEVAASVEAGVRLLEEAGCHVVPKTAGFTADDLRTAERFYQVRCRTELKTVTSERRVRAEVIDNWSEPAERMSATEFYAVFNAMQKLRERAMRLIDGVDFLVMPTVTQPPFPASLPGFAEDQIFVPWANTFLFNLTEQPSSSLPCGTTRSGLPIGLQIVGRRYNDVGVLRLSRTFEELCPYRCRLNEMINRLAVY